VLVCCWSVKGGVGTSVVAAAAAVMLAHRGEDALIVDLAGDQPSVLGVDPGGPGLCDWLAAGEDVAVDALGRLEIPVVANLALLAWAGNGRTGVDPDRLSVALALANRPARTTVVDLGVVGPDDPLATLMATADRSMLVTRACYLALRRGRNLPAGDHEVVLVAEPGRALSRGDVARALGVEAVHRVPWDPAVARAVDAGTLASRLPLALRRLEKLL
jgi:hypothetical protein